MANRPAQEFGQLGHVICAAGPAETRVQVAVAGHAGRHDRVTHVNVHVGSL